MKGRQGIVAGYNAQAMVSPTEPEGGVTGMLVTAVDVVDQANDNAMLAPMLERAEETTGTRAQMTLDDAGYFAGVTCRVLPSRAAGGGVRVTTTVPQRPVSQGPIHL